MHMLDMTRDSKASTKIGHPGRIIIRRFTEMMMHVNGDGRDEGVAGLTGGDDPAGQEQGDRIRPATDPDNEGLSPRVGLAGTPGHAASMDKLLLDMTHQRMPPHLQGRPRRVAVL